MGQIPSEPITQKETHGLGSDAYRVGSSCMQGWRATMEDAHTHILSLPGDPAAAFFAVFDGHGGDKVAEFASRHLHTVLVGRPEYSVGRVAEALQQACLQLDRMMLADETLRDVRAGTTAVCALIKDGVLYCANAGDSRAVASVCGRAEPLSVDHKPQDRREQERITAAGGSVVANRVNGYLALSRALGDFTFKQNSAVTAEHQVVTAFPDVETRQITADWEFVVLACDGIWDVMSNQEVVAFVRSRIGRGLPPETICEELLSHCLASDFMFTGVGCDNMTVVLVCLTPTGSYAALAERCSRPPLAECEDGDGEDDEYEEEEEEEERNYDDEDDAEEDEEEDGEEEEYGRAADKTMGARP
ncbi:putative protein phosphatase 2C T23F11.1 [Amphibalanus amphitrite]|uniref:protein-serine/threonine phosphatase n=1 Tax=Amphibalanus amphitrite TaxID=1232801 RepID=A0A6A4VVX5_AMPAM|nr:probable protein phosphatase 2C T23F11.1 [Amphibalanus amphitrite]XP_043242819.1 probable protein phosphatase 2C T23F11.1 [Amphibalanus amphitrite]XP_043242820.1 probable protein phosphatase 2C T23F11.1 [Amphibalanus amphitrite]KAF0294962.1 putative protein phosphatase 2C T23F11.1 [Amphibalanus amphitrite]